MNREIINSGFSYPDDEVTKYFPCLAKVVIGLFVRFGSHQSRPFAAIQNTGSFLWWTHQEQEVPNKNNNRSAQGQ